MEQQHIQISLEIVIQPYGSLILQMKEKFCTLLISLNTWKMVEIAGKYLHVSTHLANTGNANDLESF